MIIPKIIASASATGPRQSTEQLIDQIQRWSLLGRVALTEVQGWTLQELETVVQGVGGSVDLEVQLLRAEKDSRDIARGVEGNDGEASEAPTFETVALALLNSGATTIVCSPSDVQRLSAVPPERLTVLHTEHESDLSPRDQISVTDPTADQLSRWEQERVDVWVDSEFLETNPTLIADFFRKTLVSDRPDGLWSTVIVDPLGLALGLAYSNYESLLDAITHRRGTYWSRSRGGLWVKGATSGATQDLLGIRIDCDRDCLRFQVTQDAPGFCHRETHTCFGNERTIQSVIERLSERIASSDEKSFTRKLVNDPEMLRIKLNEEAGELAEAETAGHIAFEAADVLYFSLVKMLASGVRLETVHQELARRMNRVVRRKNKLEPET